MKSKRELLSQRINVWKTKNIMDAKVYQLEIKLIDCLSDKELDGYIKMSMPMLINLKHNFKSLASKKAWIKMCLSTMKCLATKSKTYDFSEPAKFEEVCRKYFEDATIVGVE